MRRIIAATIVATALFGTTWAAPGPNGRNDYGLCKAYFAGSENGRAHKRNAPPFAALEKAAGVNDDDDTQAKRDEKVAEFCKNKTPGGKSR